MTLHHGDCLDVLPTLDAESIDAIVTDPPYGLAFMGKHWDHGLPGEDFWAAMLRVAKPGAHLLAFGGTRTYHRLASAIEDAGWEIRDTLVWAYASGFPKSLDVSKAIDKANGRKFEDRYALGRHIRERREALGLSRADVNGWFGYRDGCEHWERQDESGARVPTMADWSILRKRLGLSDEWLPLVERAEAEREVVGAARGVVKVGGPDDANQWRVGAVQASVDIPITAPATDAAREWQGWGTALKPAWEPIVLARKPLRGTVAANVQAYGTGALNIDATRIGQPPPSVPQPDFRSVNGRSTHLDANARNGAMSEASGRWPANVILTDPIFDGDTPGVVGGGETGPAGVAHRTNGGGFTFGGDSVKPPMDDMTYGDSGTYSRFFLIPKAGRADREPVLGGLPMEVTKPYQGNLNNAEYEYSDGAHRDAARRPARANVHPTVKPTDLMRHLVRLVTPPGGLVLDPFMGSGTTALACEREGFRWVGIEREAEYIAIAEARLNGTQRGLGLVG